jgi:uncharacterized membrane protein YgcG
MHTSSALNRRRLRPRHGAAVGLAGALCALVVGLAVPAGAGAAGANRYTSSSVSPLPSVEVEQLLAEVPLNDLSATQLGEVLSQLPGLSILPTSTSKQALTETIEHLAGEGATLGQLAGSSELISGLEGHLKGLLSISQLLSLLKGQSLTTVLNDALGSLSSNQILSGLLGASSTPTQVIEGALTATNPTKLESLLGSTLTGEPFSKTTVGELASELGMTVEQVASDVGTTSSELPSTATALIAPLTDGKTLGVLKALEGLHLGLFEGEGGSGSSGSGSGGSGGSGSGTGSSGSGTGGSGGAGGSSSGTPAGTTVVLDSPIPSSTAVTSSSSKPASAKIKLLSKKVRGDVVTLVLSVPAAGRLTLTGHDVRSVAEQTDGAERVTLRTVLRKADAASLRRHRHHLEVKLAVAFKGTGGQRSSITTGVAFG